MSLFVSPPLPSLIPFFSKIFFFLIPPVPPHLSHPSFLLTSILFARSFIESSHALCVSVRPPFFFHLSSFPFHHPFFLTCVPPTFLSSLSLPSSLHLCVPDFSSRPYGDCCDTTCSALQKPGLAHTTSVCVCACMC